MVAKPPLPKEVDVTARPPKCVKGGLMEWFQRMADERGDHPRMLATCPKVLKLAGVNPAKLTEEFLDEAAVATLPEAKDWMKRHNRAVSEGKANGYVWITDTGWVAFGKDRNNVRGKQTA